MIRPRFLCIFSLLLSCGILNSAASADPVAVNQGPADDTRATIDGWKIMHIADTHQTEGCETPPEH